MRYWLKLSMISAVLGRVPNHYYSANVCIAIPGAEINAILLTGLLSSKLSPILLAGLARFGLVWLYDHTVF